MINTVLKNQHALSRLWLILPIMTLCLFIAQQDLRANPLSPGDFAYSAALSNGNASLRQVDLPGPVYQKLQRYDRGDLRVFNASGQLVPHQFKLPSSKSQIQETPLTFYPFSKQQASNPANIRIIIDQKAGQHHLDISQQNGDAQVPVINEYQYIIETGLTQNGPKNRQANKKQPAKPGHLCTIRLDWEQSKVNMMLPFTLDSSNDLQIWVRLGGPLNVSNLRYAGAQLLRQAVDFPCTSKKYLRLTWLKNDPQIHLKKISGLYSQNGVQMVQWKSLASPVVDKKGNWLFENDVAAPWSRMEFVAPLSGLLYKGNLYSRHDKKSPWKFRQKVIQYRLHFYSQNPATQGQDTQDQGTHDTGKQDEQDVRSTAFNVNEHSERYWKFQPDNEVRMGNDQLPEIKIGWPQLQLIFLAQGKPPFQLCYGNASIKPLNDIGLMKLINDFRKSNITPETVTMGVPQRNENWQLAKAGISWRKAGLWVLLLSGTALLGYMALSLYRQMDDKK